MRKLAVLVSLAAATALPAAYPASAAAQDDASIKKVQTDFAAAWNRHDPVAMASFWTEDGDLINPFGRWAKGRAEIVKLFQDEQATVMKGSTYSSTLTSLKSLAPDVAVTDWDIEVVGMHAPDGSALPPFRPHLTIVLVKKGGQWAWAAARPYQFLPSPGPSK
jgi:uncharacterized protein (TIGR02246 family)